MPPRKNDALVTTGPVPSEVYVGERPADWVPTPLDYARTLDLAEETHLAVIRARVRNGTSDFQDARWLLGILDKVLGT